MSTHNICFHGEIRKLLCGYPLLSVAMFLVFHIKCPANISVGTGYPFAILFLSLYPQIIFLLMNLAK